jgi:hypothetical protein
VKREFLIERQGRSFVLYAGLLDEAHEKGLKSIRTEMLQAPTAENGETTICMAVVEMGDGRVFTGIGDATPQNVGRNIVPHAIRMAETRSKARALRDAINVGAVALEELGELEDGPSAPSWEEPPAAPRQRPAAPGAAPTPLRRGAPPAAASGATAGAASGGDLATPAQVRAIYLIGRDQHSMSEADVDARSVELYGLRPAELSKKQASGLITALKGASQSASA